MGTFREGEKQWLSKEEPADWRRLQLLKEHAPEVSVRRRANAEEGRFVHISQRNESRLKCACAGVRVFQFEAIDPRRILHRHLNDHALLEKEGHSLAIREDAHKCCLTLFHPYRRHQITRPGSG